MAGGMAVAAVVAGAVTMSVAMTALESAQLFTPLLSLLALLPGKIWDGRTGDDVPEAQAVTLTVQKEKQHGLGWHHRTHQMNDNKR